jgi:hypothetical protein
MVCILDPNGRVRITVIRIKSLVPHLLGAYALIQKARAAAAAGTPVPTGAARNFIDGSTKINWDEGFAAAMENPQNGLYMHVELAIIADRRSIEIMYEGGEKSPMAAYCASRRKHIVPYMAQIDTRALKDFPLNIGAFADATVNIAHLSADSIAQALSIMHAVASPIAAIIAGHSNIIMKRPVMTAFNHYLTQFTDQSDTGAPVRESGSYTTIANTYTTEWRMRDANNKATTPANRRYLLFASTIEGNGSNVVARARASTGQAERTPVLKKQEHNMTAPMRCTMAQTLNLLNNSHPNIVKNIVREICERLNEEFLKDRAKVTVGLHEVEVFLGGINFVGVTRKTVEIVNY